MPLYCFLILRSVGGPKNLKTAIWFSPQTCCWVKDAKFFGQLFADSRSPAFVDIRFEPTPDYLSMMLQSLCIWHPCCCCSRLHLWIAL